MNSTVNSFKFLYVHGCISMEALRKAVLDTAITSVDYKEITGEDYTEQ